MEQVIYVLEILFEAVKCPYLIPFYIAMLVFTIIYMLLAVFNGGDLE